MTKETPKNILIVDDDDDVVRMISIFLGSRGYCCSTAKTGAQGERKFLLNDVDMVITDLHMPVGDGAALIERIRNTKDVPIVIITGFSEQYARRVEHIRDVTMLQKPFDPHELRSIVERKLAMQTDPPHEAKVTCP